MSYQHNSTSNTSGDLSFDVPVEFAEKLDHLSIEAVLIACPDKLTPLVRPFCYFFFFCVLMSCFCALIPCALFTVFILPDSLIHSVFLVMIVNKNKHNRSANKFTRAKRIKITAMPCWNLNAMGV